MTGGQFPADGTGTASGRSPRPPTSALGHRIPGFGGRGPTQTRTHSHVHLFFPGNKCRKLSGCFPPPSFAPLRPHSGLLLQPCLRRLPCVPLWGPRRHPRSLCRWGAQSAMHHLCPPLAFPHHLQRLGRNRGKLGLSLSVHTIYPPSSHEGKKKSKTKTKKIFCTEIYFYYTKFVQYQKNKRKKGVNFFFHYCR